MRLAGLEAVLTLALVEDVGLKFPARVFLDRRHVAKRPRRGPLRPSALPVVGTQRGRRRILRWPPQARKGLPAHAAPRLLAAASKRARRLAPRPAARPLRAHGRTRPRAAASTAAAPKAPAGKSSRRAHRAPTATAN